MVAGGTAHGKGIDHVYQLVSTCVFRGAPASVYKGAKGGGGAGQEEVAQEESYSYRE